MVLTILSCKDTPPPERAEGTRDVVGKPNVREEGRELPGPFRTPKVPAYLWIWMFPPSSICGGPLLYVSVSIRKVSEVPGSPQSSTSTVKSS